MFADLHTHTTASDGTLTPAEVVYMAKGKGFSAIAITDHDTTNGLEEALAESVRQKITVIPGIELSTLQGDREIHLLGYFLDRHCRLLQDMLTKIIDARHNRAAEMVDRLIAMSINISLDQVKEFAGTEFIGRPHIARALLENGYIEDISAAFSEEFIGRGGRAYVERFKLSPAEGIALLLKAEAVPVLAHPGYLSQGQPMDESEIADLVFDGLAGLEVYYSRHTPEQEGYYKKIAEKYQLLITGGSDCHSNMDVTNCLGSIKLPYQYVEALINRKSGSG